ncbi:MAG TPA: dihydrolipoyl dehydrogenase [Thioalkalivibrio sp.]|nr:dihydrolipoyl dehydrogenase [Thioalkalivibrio sp.]
MSADYDIIIIGAGPAGYVAAIRAAQLGMKTACIDRWLAADGKPALGGTCLNAGCIPSKALLESTEQYELAANGFAGHGIRIGKLELDLAAMHARKQGVVDRLTRGIERLFKGNGITWLQGEGKLLGPGKVAFTAHGKSRPEELASDHVIIATGSTPIELGGAPLDGTVVVDSTGALAFDEVPKRLAVIGAGVIGLELGSVWRRLGAEVVMLEAQDRFLPVTDGEVAQAALRLLRDQGLDIRLGCRLMTTRVGKAEATLDYTDGEGKSHTFKADRVVVAVGRRPLSDDVYTQESGLLLDERGYIHVNEFCETNLPGVYAVGDVVRGAMLAHKGSEEGCMVVERIAGQSTTLDYGCVPSVIYTQPEIAWVGRTEEDLKTAGEAYHKGVFPLAASGRAQARGETDGFVKLLASAETDRILGAHIVGPGASELISEATIAMAFQASAEDLARTVFAHPTLSEAVHEAALAVGQRAIHMATGRKRQG